MEGEIPVINMQGEDTSNKIREACEKWGCFRAVNHGVPIDLMAKIKSVAADLFDRTVEIKKGLPGNGYLTFGGSNNPTYEALSVDFSSQSLPSFFSQLDASPHQREVIEKYNEGVKKLAMEIASKMAKSMGLQGLEDYSFSIEPSNLRFNKYIITRDNIGIDGLNKHTDATLITILQDAGHFVGLEIVDPSSGNFVPVDPSPGTFVVLLGDIAVPWSNGKLQSVQHRAVCNNVGVRMSIVTGCNPVKDEVVVAHPKFVASDCGAKYVPFTYAEFKELRSSEKLFAGEVLELLRAKN